MRLLTSIFLVASLVSTAFADPSLSDLQGRYDERSAEFDEVITNALASALDQYRNDLEEAKESYRKRGDLDGVLAADKEIERLAAEGDCPEEDAAGTPSKIKKARRTCRGRCAGVHRKGKTRLQSLTSAYHKHLEKLQKRLVVQERLDEAILVRDELERVEGIVAEMRSSRTKSTTARKITVSPDDKRIKTDVGVLVKGERMANNRKYMWETIPEKYQGLNFLRMNCRANGSYGFRVEGTCTVFMLVVTNPTDGSELEKAGWWKSPEQMTSNVGNIIFVYKQKLAPGEYRTISTGHWAYMLVSKHPIEIAK